MKRLDLGSKIQKYAGKLSSSSRKEKSTISKKDYMDEPLPLSQQRSQNNRGNRIFFYKPGCNVCPKMHWAVDRANERLRHGREIEKIDITRPSPEKKFIQPEGTPALYMGGILVTGATTTAGAVGLLKGFLQDEFLFPMPSIENTPEM